MREEIGFENGRWPKSEVDSGTWHRGSIPSGTNFLFFIFYFFKFLSLDGLENRMEGSLSVSWAISGRFQDPGDRLPSSTVAL